MKKILSAVILFGLTLSLSVSAFARTDKKALTKSEMEGIYGSSFVGDTDNEIALYNKAYKHDGTELRNDDVLPSGTAIYYPIVVPNIDNANTDVDWYFATTSRDTSGYNVRINKSVNSSLVQGGEIVPIKLKDLKFSDNSEVTDKVRCVEVKLNPYYGSKTEQDTAFSIQFRGGRNTHSGGVVFDSNDYDKISALTEVFVGKEAESPVPETDPASVTGYSGKIRGGNLSFRINDNTRVVRLDEFEGQEVKSISISGGNLDFTFDVNAVRQTPLFLQVNNKPDPKIADKYYNFDLEFLSFPGSPMFDQLGTLSIGVSDIQDKYYVYQIEDGVLKKVDARFDQDSNCLVLKTRVLGDYVISRNAELSAAAETVIPDKPSEDITVGSTEKDPTVGANGGSKPNFNSGDNSILPAMAILGTVSAATVVGLVSYRKKNK